MSQTPTNKGRLREPPPALFLGPPSQNASNVSLPSAHQMGANLAPTTTAMSSSTTASRNPLARQRSQRINPRTNGDAITESPTAPAHARVLPRIETESQMQADRTDALWAQMQSTLEEVELTAVNGVHVFGPEHTKALEGLRMAQIALAQAWARSEADDAIETVEKDTKDVRGSGMGSTGRSMSDTEAGKSTGNSGSGMPGSSSGEPNIEGKLEDETEADIRLARRRREANDRYFERVNDGVLDVVAKLQVVADAMKGVEEQSRDIWEDSDASPATRD